MDINLPHPYISSTRYVHPMFFACIAPKRDIPGIGKAKYSQNPILLSAGTHLLEKYYLLLIVLDQNCFCYNSVSVIISVAAEEYWGVTRMKVGLIPSAIVADFGNHCNASKSTSLVHSGVVSF